MRSSTKSLFTCRFLAAAIFFMFACSTIHAQDVALQDEAPATLNGNDKTFAQIRSDLLVNEKEINNLFSSIPIGFPKLQAEHMKLIDALRETNQTLTSQLESAAIKAFQAAPANSPQASQHVYSLLMQNLDGTNVKYHYNPQRALEIADMMLKTGLKNSPIRYEEVAYQAFRASFAIQDFGRAELMIKKIEERGFPIQAKLTKRLADAKTKWQRELMIRRTEDSANDLPRVKLETTEGEIVVELFENQAPQTVGNFISLVEKNFYNELKFFIVRPGEFAKTGCQNANGTGNPGYSIPCECNGEEIRHHFTGTLSMTTTGRDTGGSQFFITHQRDPSFDGKHTAFGRVIEGMDVVYKLRIADGLNDIGSEPSEIIKATVIRKRDHEYTPTRLANGDASNKVGDSSGTRLQDRLTSSASHK